MSNNSKAVIVTAAISAADISKAVDGIASTYGACASLAKGMQSPKFEWDAFTGKMQELNGGKPVCGDKALTKQAYSVISAIRMKVSREGYKVSPRVGTEKGEDGKETSSYSAYMKPEDKGPKNPETPLQRAGNAMSRAAKLAVKDKVFQRPEQLAEATTYATLAANKAMEPDTTKAASLSVVSVLSLLNGAFNSIPDYDSRATLVQAVRLECDKLEAIIESATEQGEETEDTPATPPAPAGRTLARGQASSKVIRQ